MTSTENRVQGGCYCGALRYQATPKTHLTGLCYCRPCQQFSGGGPQIFQLVSPEQFEWTTGTPAAYTQSSLDQPVTRFFCHTCGTQIITQRPDQRDLVLKAGTLDDPSLTQPKFAICINEAQPFHTIPTDVPTFEGIPPRAQ